MTDQPYIPGCRCNAYPYFGVFLVLLQPLLSVGVDSAPIKAGSNPCAAPADLPPEAYESSPQTYPDMSAFAGLPLEIPLQDEEGGDGLRTFLTVGQVLELSNQPYAPTAAAPEECEGGKEKGASG